MGDEKGMVDTTPAPTTANASLPKVVRIAVDAMGGDKAPDINVRGALLAISKVSQTEGAVLKLVLVGNRAVLEPQLKKYGGKESETIVIHHCDEVISMDDHATSAIRKKKNSSIHVGLQLLEEGQVDAFISAGNSGAVMAGALLINGRLSDVERPAIVIKLPTAEGSVILLDVGANVDCKPIHLSQFAEMGHVYAEIIEGIPFPRIGLLSNGSESHKGNELTREPDALLRQRKGLNYRGYVEGFDLFRGTADVVVCDGFVGNVLLKLSEGLAETTVHWFKKEVHKTFLGMLGVTLLRKVVRRFKQKFDYQPYGAAPLLGINGMVLISHGSSTEIAIRNGILTARRGVQQNFISKISKHLEQHLSKGTRTEAKQTT